MVQQGMVHHKGSILEKSDEERGHDPQHDVSQAPAFPYAALLARERRKAAPRGAHPRPFCRLLAPLPFGHPVGRPLPNEAMQVGVVPVPLPAPGASRERIKGAQAEGCPCDRVLLVEGCIDGWPNPGTAPGHLRERKGGRGDQEASARASSAFPGPSRKISGRF